MAKKKDVEVNGQVNNGKIDVPSILLIPVVINKNNVVNVLISSGYFKEKDIY